MTMLSDVCGRRGTPKLTDKCMRGGSPCMAVTTNGSRVVAPAPPLHMDTPSLSVGKGSGRREKDGGGGPDQVMVTQVGLRIPLDISYDNWETAGRRLASVATSSSWCLGDWVNYGQHRYADRYRRANDMAALDHQTIRNYAWVGRRGGILRARRPFGLSQSPRRAAGAGQERGAVA